MRGGGGQKKLAVLLKAFMEHILCVSDGLEMAYPVLPKRDSRILLNECDCVQV